jgi:hypothetical protein
MVGAMVDYLIASMYRHFDKFHIYFLVVDIPCSLVLIHMSLLTMFLL